MSIHIGASSEENEPLLVRQLQPQTSNDSPKSSRRWITTLAATLCLSLAVVFEGFSYYCILLGAVQGEHLRNLENEPISSTLIGLIFKGTCFFLPVFAGTLADSVLGHFKTMFVGAVLYVTGGFILIVMVYPCKHGGDKVLIGLNIVSLVFLATGRALYKTSLTVIFAYQLIFSFGSSAILWVFSWFYFCLYLGGLPASFILAMEISTVETMALGVTISIAASILCVLVGYKFFIPQEQSNKKVLIRTLQIFVTKVRNCVKSDKVLMDNTFLHRFQNEASLTSHKKDISSARQLGQIMPLFGIFIIYWMSYAQLLSGFASEARDLSQLFENKNIHVHAVTINIFTVSSWLVCMPAIYSIIRLVPCQNLTLLVKIGVGIAFMCVAMVTASLTGLFHGKIYSQWYLLPQCTFVAISEIFAVVEGAAFAYSQSPSGLEGTVMGLFLCSDGVGSYLSTGLTALVNSDDKDPWFPSSKNSSGHLDWFFYILAGSVALSFGVYVIVARNYQYYKQVTAAEEGNIAVSTSSDYYVGNRR